MRVAIAGAGAVGRSIAGELLENGHEVLLIDNAPTAISVERVPQAEWLLADACEITSLDEAALQRCNVVIAATGDDKVNLVVSSSRRRSTASRASSPASTTRRTSGSSTSPGASTWPSPPRV